MKKNLLSLMTALFLGSATLSAQTVEIEEQGAYTTLQPGEEVDWTVRWYLVPTDLPAEPSKALLKKVRAILK